jgi:hypothetical protein
VQSDPVAAVVWLLIVLAFVAIVSATFRKRRVGGGGSTTGAAATGAIYDLLNQDKRNAIELIVEDKAAARDPESADGKLHP